MIRPRWLAKFLAWIGRYFWIPCPICRQYFAGFEQDPYADDKINKRNYPCLLVVGDVYKFYDHTGTFVGWGRTSSAICKRCGAG